MRSGHYRISIDQTCVRGWSYAGRKNRLERFLTSRQRWPEGRLPWMAAARSNRRPSLAALFTRHPIMKTPTFGSAFFVGIHKRVFASVPPLPNPLPQAGEGANGPSGFAIVTAFAAG